MSKPAQKSAGPVPSNRQDTVTSAKTPARGLADQAKQKEPAGKRAKSATVKQASSTKGHQ